MGVEAQRDHLASGFVHQGAVGHHPGGHLPGELDGLGGAGGQAQNPLIFFLSWGRGYPAGSPRRTPSTPDGERRGAARHWRG